MKQGDDYSISRPMMDDVDGIRDAKLARMYDKRDTTGDAMNPVPRATGLVPVKPTSARTQF